MVDIKEKKDCCGCSACVQRCPKQCITMVEDEEGFLYPRVDTSLCIDCHLCELVCPVINQGEPREPLQCFAAINPDENIRQVSSSGGIFTMLAEQTIKNGGVVFGARFDEHWEVVHDCTDNVEGLAQFRGSKYVQSRIGNCYCRIEQLLKEGRKVLFSGTPCQIAGLHRFLRKEYDSLLTVDIICHGVPSPSVWRKYLTEEVTLIRSRENAVLPPDIQGKSTLSIDGISFRNKSSGWKKYSFALILSAIDARGEKFSFCLRSLVNENPYLCGFNVNLYLRPSCYDCPAKCGKSQSDITIGDFWGIERVMPQMCDDEGVSMVLPLTERGAKALMHLPGLNALDALRASEYNRTFAHSSMYNGNRYLFFKKLRKKSFLCLFQRYVTPNFGQRALNFIERNLYK